MSLLANSNAIESGGYNIDRSLRFRSSASAYLNRTPASASSRTTWTWSGWLKIGKVGQTITLFKAGVTNDSDNRAEFTIDSSGIIYFYSADSAVTKNYVSSNQVFRDPSAWYHLICVYDSTNATSSNRVKMYVNGTQITSLSGATYASQNTTTLINNNVFHVINYNNYSSGPVYGDGYLAEVNFIDGQALTPSSFGQTDAITGVWVPKKYTGTYGTNGFYLDFKDNTSATTLAYDKSGNGNNWTANNISTTAGSTYDSMLDVPTLTSATAANFSVLNPLYTLNTVPTFANGNLQITANNGGAFSTIGLPSTGKWYFETTVLSGGATTNNDAVGIARNQPDFFWRVYRSGGTKDDGTTGTSYGATWTTGDTIGTAWDADSGDLSFYKNGVSQGVAYSGVTDKNVMFFVYCRASTSVPTMASNFGQRPFSYTPPAGFVALNTFNLPDPTIKKPNQYMDATTYTANGTTQSITNAGSFQPDLVWLKKRSATGYHYLMDAVRGASKYLSSNVTDAEGTDANYLTAFNSNGWSMGSSNDGSGATMVGWQWKESATAGFDIVTYTGTGSARTISHNLGVAPKMIFVKARSTTGEWDTYHASLPSASYYLVLNATDAQATSSGVWNATAPTSSVFSVGTSGSTNGNGTTFVAYLFAEIPGYSKFGSYTGNGSTDGPFVYCGFRPSWIMVKRTDSATSANWLIGDSKRLGYNLTAGGNKQLKANTSDQEFDFDFDYLSNGFKVRNTDSYINANGGTFIFAAFAENPTKYALAR